MRMPEEFYRTGSYETDHTTFGGLIHYSDFCTDYRGKDEDKSPIADRIMSDWKFDMQCEKNVRNKTNYNNCRNK